MVAGSTSGGLKIGGLAATINIDATDAAIDKLTINALAGNDTIDASYCTPA